MNSLQSKGGSESDDSDILSNELESSLQLPLHRSMPIVFTGYYNGVGVELEILDHMKLLYHLGCFGKGTASRSRPKILDDSSPTFMRRRQFLKRSYWYNRFGKSEKTVAPDSFFKDIDQLISKILSNTKNQSGKDVIDLVSSEDEVNEETGNVTEQSELYVSNKQNVDIIVPNSDSEDDNYFEKLKPKCCINKVTLREKLVLTLQESFFLLYGLGCLQIVNIENEIINVDECWKLFTEVECHFTEKYVVYHYFRSKGYIVKPGIKFGGDYLLYRDGPGVNHADYIVVINFDKNELDSISLLGHVRMSSTTVKEILMAEVTKSSKENIKLPQDLFEYSVRVVGLTRKIPLIISNDDD